LKGLDIESEMLAELADKEQAETPMARAATSSGAR
jgi:hypothetical protein